MSKKWLLRTTAYSLAYAGAYFLDREGLLKAACTLLLLTGAAAYAGRVRESGSVIDLAGLFSISWLGGQGLACLRLSRLQEGWPGKTWLCFYLIFLMVHAGHEAARVRSVKKGKVFGKEADKKGQADRILIGVLVIAITAAVSFLLEAGILGFVPLFSDQGHAYLEFHVSGLHYFTVNSVMVPALTILYLRAGDKTKRRKLILLACNTAALLIPVLCVSRYQLIFAAVLAVMVYISAYGKGTLKVVLPIAFALLGAYVLLSAARNQDTGYLNGIFEMRDSRVPVWISQPYMYITANYDNFNCMVENLTHPAYDGVRMLYPFFALTGLKFLFPVQISRPPFLVKEELSTFTMFYDSYYDFGIIGLCVFSVIIGAVTALLLRKRGESQNEVIHLFYGQMGIYLLLSFFTTWFSDPAVWFRLIETWILYRAVVYQRKTITADKRKL